MRKYCVFFFVFALLLTSCGSKALETINPEVLPTNTPPPAPESGKATIVGRIVHEGGIAIPKIIVRLADVARGVEGRGGAYILDVARSPGTITDENGYFIIPNVKAGEYVIVVGDIEITGVYEIIQEADGKAKVWNLPADQVTNVSDLVVKIEPPKPNPTKTPGPYPEPTAYPNP